MSDEKETGLILQKEMSAVEIYTGGKMDDILSEIKKQVEEFDADIATTKGRKEISSMAYKIARSKTYLDDLGKELKSEAQKTVKSVDAERKKMRDELDSLKDQVKKPLDDMNAKIAAEAEAIEKRITEIKLLGEVVEFGVYLPLETLENREKILKSTDIDISFANRQKAAQAFLTESIQNVENALIFVKKQKAEKEALEKLEAEAAEKAKKEREEQIRKEAEERSRLEAEARAKAEAERAERERIESEARIKREAEAKIEEERQKVIKAEELRIAAEEEAKKAEQDRIDFEKHKTEREEQIRLAEAKRIEEAAVQKQIEQKILEDERQNNIEHQKKINNEALKDLMVILDEVTAKSVIVAIAQSKIANIRIIY